MQFVGGAAAATDFHYFHHSAFFRSCLGDQLTNEDGGKAKQSKFEVGHFPTNLSRKQQQQQQWKQQQQKAHLISLNSTRKGEGDEKQNLVSIFRRTLCPSFFTSFSPSPGCKLCARTLTCKSSGSSMPELLSRSQHKHPYYHLLHPFSEKVVVN